MCEIVKKIYLQELLYVNWMKTTYGDDLRKSFCETMTRAQFHAKVCKPPDTSAESNSHC